MRRSWHRIGTVAWDFPRLNEVVLSERTAAEFIDELDLDRLGACPMCLFDLARTLREGRRPTHGLVNRTADWVWLEIEESLTSAVVRARMREIPHAEDALYDLDLNGWEGILVRAVVLRLASEMADEMSRS
jgi:hypothetical protein